MSNQKFGQMQYHLERNSIQFLVFVFLVLVSILLSVKLERSLAATLGSPPTIIAVSPSDAYNWSETEITITGTNFVPTTSVLLGNIHLNPISFISSNTLTTTAPADWPAGVYTFTVTNPDGQSASLANGFTVLMSGNGDLGAWQSAASMGFPRNYPAAVISGSWIYVLGGLPNCDISICEVERAWINADGSLGAWENTISLNENLYGPAAVITNNYLYVLGGQGANVKRAQINLDGSLGSWQNLASMKEPRSAFSAVVIGRYIYAIGGPGGTSVERAEILTDGSLGTWEYMSPTNIGRSGSPAVVAGNYVYVLGGIYSRTSIERAGINADGSLTAWQELSPMSTPRNRFAAVVSAGYLYVLGGEDGSENLDSVERALINPDGTLGVWQPVSSMLSSRESLAAVAKGRYLYAFGGGLLDGRGMRSVEYASINPTLMTNFTPSSVTSDYVTNITIRGSGFDLLSQSTLQLGDAIPLTVSYVSPITLTTNIPAGLSSGWYSATLTNGDGRKSMLPHALRVDGPGPVVVGDYSLTINDGALFTNNTSVTLTIGSLTNTAKMQLSNDGSFAGASWETYTSHKNWQITQYGNYVIPRIVYVRYQDLNGNVFATFQDDIVLDVTPPDGGFQIITGTQNTVQVNSYPGGIAEPNPALQAHSIYAPLVTKGFINCIRLNCIQLRLNLWAVDDVSGVGRMMISNQPDFFGAEWEPYMTIKDWQVSSSGSTIIYVKFSDNAGNISAVYSKVFTPS